MSCMATTSIAPGSQLRFSEGMLDFQMHIPSTLSTLATSTPRRTWAIVVADFDALSTRGTPNIGLQKALDQQSAPCFVLSVLFLR